MMFAWAMTFFLVLPIAPVYSEYYSKTVTPAARVEKVTHLHFFLHDVLSGENAIALMIARPNLTNKGNTPNPFGVLFAIDDRLTAGPEPTSKTIGNAQGLYLLSSQDVSKLTLVLYIDFAFTTGKFNGSSFCVFSRNPVSEAEREVAIVGGRGEFRMARGFAKTRTTFMNATTANAVLEYNVTLYHY
ncbi:hypothetical protein DITRI_Ditri01bG0038200 [Diplodiscus trichospermus]